MAFETGTATDYKDLVAKLRAFATANGWTENRYLVGDNGEDELIMTSDGATGQEQIVVGYRTITNVGDDVFNLDLFTGPAYNTNDFDNQPGRSPRRVIHLWNATIEYWFMVSKERILIVANVSTTWQLSYNGKVRTYTSRGHWPTPLISAGSSSNPDWRWSVQDSGNMSSLQWSRGTAAPTIRQPNDAWANCSGPYPTAVTSNAPWGSNTVNQENGDAGLLPLAAINSTYFAMGEFEGCFGLSGEKLGAGQILNPPAAGNDFLVVQNVYRNGFADYLAVELT